MKWFKQSNATREVATDDMPIDEKQRMAKTFSALSECAGRLLIWEEVLSPAPGRTRSPRCSLASPFSAENQTCVCYIAGGSLAASRAEGKGLDCPAVPASLHCAPARPSR